MTDQIPLVPVKRATSSTDTRQPVVTRSESTTYPKSRSNYSISSNGGKSSGKSGNNNNTQAEGNGSDGNNNKCLRRSRSLSLTPLYTAAGIQNRRLRRPQDRDPLLSFAAEQDDLEAEEEEEEEEVSVKTALLPDSKKEKEPSVDSCSAASEFCTCR